MIKTLQAGRAIAALCVVAFHLSIMMGAPRYGGEAVFREFTLHGNRGVDFFFVLSGFIILFAHYKDIGNPESFGKYIYRRFSRVFPIYWLYTFIFVLLLVAIGGVDANMPSTAIDWMTTITLVRFSDVSPPLSVAWTLFHEIAFYATFSMLILNRRLGIIVFLLICAISIIFYHFPTEHGRTPFSVYTSAYNLYFLFGMGAYWLYQKGGSGVAELILGLAISLMTITDVIIPDELLRISLALGMALLLAAVTKFESSGKIAVPNLLIVIGNASYSIYLTHISIEGVILKVMKATHLQTSLGNELTYFITLICTVIIGCFAYCYIEKPLIGLFSKPKKLYSNA